MDRIQYVLNGLSEEATELGQASCKALRFGLLDVDPKTGQTNLQHVVNEYNDVKAMLKLLEEELSHLGIPLEGLDAPSAIQAKITKFLKWGARSMANGTLQDDLQDRTIIHAAQAPAFPVPASPSEGNQDNG
jgi:hypothetical protein